MKNMNTVEITKIGLVAAVLCIIAPLSIPIGPVPISFTNFIIYVAIFAIGSRRGLVSYLVYLLIGLVGLPVFSGFSGGPGKLFGPTGGYLFGFIFIFLISGYFIEKNYKDKKNTILAMIIGTVVCYFFGTIWLNIQTGMGLSQAFMAGVIPFIPGDLLKIAVAAFAGEKIREALIQNKLYGIKE